MEADLSGWLLLASVIFLLVTWARQKAVPAEQLKSRRGARVVRSQRPRLRCWAETGASCSVVKQSVHLHIP